MNSKSNAIKTVFFSIIACTVLFAVSAAIASSGGADAGPTWWGLPTEKLWDLLYRTLNFAGLMFILIYFLAKPIANALSARQMAIKSQFEELEAQKSEADKAYKEFEQQLSQIDQEVKGIIANAVAQGEAEKERIITDANRAAEDIKRQAEMSIQHELSAAKMQLREEVANQAVTMAEEIIGKNLQQADHVKLIEDYLEKVGTIQ